MPSNMVIMRYTHIIYHGIFPPTSTNLFSPRFILYFHFYDMQQNDLLLLINHYSKYSHELNVPALESFLVKNVPGFVRPLEVSQFKLGQSNPTYMLRGGK